MLSSKYFAARYFSPRYLNGIPSSSAGFLDLGWGKGRQREAVEQLARRPDDLEILLTFLVVISDEII
jgi:hypothetical protein